MNKKIYQILTKRQYNRGEPHLKARVGENIARFVEFKQPIKLIGFWGVGSKSKPNWADLDSCQFLDKLNQEIQEVYEPGLEFTFIFATLHGTHNGYLPLTIQSYTQAMAKVFDEFGFKYLYLDPLWKKYGISFDKIEKIHQAKPQGWWDQVEGKEIIKKNALARNKRLAPREAAQRYFIMRALEKEMLENEFAGHIFHAFSDPRLRSVLPDMPTLYFYSRKGWSDTPWFVIKDKAV